MFFLLLLYGERDNEMTDNKALVFPIIEIVTLRLFLWLFFVKEELILLSFFFFLTIKSNLRPQKKRATPDTVGLEVTNLARSYHLIC